MDPVEQNAHGDDAPEPKRKRLAQACDVCRRKKVKNILFFSFDFYYNIASNIPSIRKTSIPCPSIFYSNLLFFSSNI
ncbi:hypothetical protein BDC45DRAFT_506477 [Circinella umbellata]|nr:hypothetical protein BDC45DRAFT_506477 [Circinella umbellata]